MCIIVKFLCNISARYLSISPVRYSSLATPRLRLPATGILADESNKLVRVYTSMLLIPGVYKGEPPPIVSSGFVPTRYGSGRGRDYPHL